MAVPGVDFWGGALVILEWKVQGGSHSIPREPWFVARFEKCGSKKPVLKVSLDQRHEHHLPLPPTYWISNCRKGEGERAAVCGRCLSQGHSDARRSYFSERTGIFIRRDQPPLIRVEREPGVKIDFTFVHLLVSWWTQPKLWTGCVTALSLLGETARVTFQIIVLSGEDIGSSQL